MMNILFTGNSFTYVNDLPAVFRAMCNGQNIPVHAEMIAYGGYSLYQYTDPQDPHGREVLPKLSEHTWDYVVLQEQSRTPALNYECFSRGVEALLPAIREAGATPVFYKTWAYRKNSSVLQETGMAYGEMLYRLSEGYAREVEKSGGLGVEIGLGFFCFQEDHPEIDLFSREDDYHPSPAGTCLAAALFLKKLCRADVPENFRMEGLSEETVSVIRQWVRCFS